MGDSVRARLRAGLCDGLRASATPGGAHVRAHPLVRTAVLASTDIYSCVQGLRELPAPLLPHFMSCIATAHCPFMYCPASLPG